MSPRPEGASRPSSAVAAVQRIELIRGSIVCCALGGIGLIPWLGVPFAFVAWRLAGQRLQEGRDVWNPARGYLVAGRVLAGVGCAVSLISLTVLLAGCWLTSN